MARTIRIYHAGNIEINTTYDLSPVASKHLLKVLRLKPGSEFYIFDGKGNEYLARYTEATKKLLTALIIKEVPTISESPLQIHLGQAISRGEKMDYAIQKAVELGVSSITPLYTQNSQIKYTGERLAKKMQHWQGIIIHATQQCGRATLAKLNPAQEVVDWLAHQKEVTFMCAITRSGTPASLTKKPNNVALCIGAEGGWTTAEIEFAAKQKINFLQLGPRVLRTETAVPVAMSLLQNAWGDIQSNFLLEAL